jgi:hypothetical protein
VALQVFVLGDLLTRNADLEDERNAMTAAVVLAKNPWMKIRLMILRPENETLATHLGVGAQTGELSPESRHESPESCNQSPKSRHTSSDSRHQSPKSRQKSPKQLA